jgi:hypothetical protein
MGQPNKKAEPGMVKHGLVRHARFDIRYLRSWPLCEHKVHADFDRSSKASVLGRLNPVCFGL